MENRNNKTNAILRLHGLKNTWCCDIEYDDGSLKELLKEIASDIFEGYVTYESFLEIMFEAAGIINLNEKQVTEADIDKYIAFVKNELSVRVVTSEMQELYKEEKEG